MHAYIHTFSHERQRILASVATQTLLPLDTVTLPVFVRAASSALLRVLAS